MGLLLYNTGIFLFGSLMRLAALFNPKAGKWIDGRRGLLESLKITLEGNKAPVLWFHCASLGEFEQGRPLIEKLREMDPAFKIMLTFFSPSGFEVRKNYEKADWVFYLPLDTASNAATFVEIVKPKAAFFIKYEFWYHFVNELHKRNIPVYSASAIFRPNQIFFKPYGGFMRNILKKFSMIFVQDKASYQLLETIDIRSVIAGDTRFDRVKFLCDNRKSLPVIEKFKGKEKLLVIGSSWPADLEIVSVFINNNLSFFGAENAIKVIIAPHEIDKKKLEQMCFDFEPYSILYSEMEEKQTDEARILIIDNIGMLSSIYAYADFAYVGGAFGKGLHNILEAATYGMPVFFGPNYGKFKEAVDLVALGGAFSVGNESQFNDAFNKVLLSEESRKTSADISRKYVEDHVGATGTIIQNLELIRK